MSEPDGQFSRTPRNDQGAEQAVLGAMLQDRAGDTFDEITTLLGGPLAFYRPQHGALYEALLQYRASGLPVGDVLTFTEQLDSEQLKRVGGVPYIHTCMSAVPTVVNGAYYARQVAELALLRDLETQGIKTIQMARQAAPSAAADVLEVVQADFGQLALGGATDLDIPTWQTSTQDALNEIERIGEMAQSGVIPGIPTGFSDLDRLLNNLQGGQLIVAAGRPGMGKSVFGRCLFLNAAMLRQDAFLFTLEMGRNECTMALLSAGSRVPLHRIKSGQLEDSDWTKIARFLGDHGDATAYIDDRPGIGLADARVVLRRHIARGGKPKLLVWDYAQITHIPSGRRDRGREQEVAELARGFKLLAKEFDIPAILISQLNRGPEQRADKRPQLSDLRESGSLEQDADIVIFIHRDDYYDKQSPRAGEADFIIAKHRGGPTDTVTVAAQLHLQRFVDMAIV